MKKGLSLILTAVFLTAMLMVGGMSALAAGEADPEDAKSVLDLSYLTKDQALDGSAGAAVFSESVICFLKKQKSIGVPSGWRGRPQNRGSGTPFGVSEGPRTYGPRRGESLSGEYGGRARPQGAVFQKIFPAATNVPAHGQASGPYGEAAIRDRKSVV